ncbi:MAG TPA: extracellular solute-binding protein [Chloroflexota bacterium]|nr:extracellular solute-binding protein [Chloroflexota bacterium]
MSISPSRRTFLRLLGVSGALSVVAACGAPAPANTPEPPAKTDAKPAEPAKPGPADKPSTAPAPAKPAATGQPITVEFLHPWEGNHGGARAMIALAKRYEELKSNVKINQTIVTGAEYERKQLAAFASGVVPDMTLTTAETVPVYGDREVLVPLDDYMKRDKLNPKDWFDFTIAQCTWKGKLYAMTHHPDVRSIVYRNVPLMQQAGLDGSKPPTSWDELKEWGTKMNKKDGNRVTQYGWVPAWIQNNWAIQYPQANGQVFLDQEGRKISYDSPATVEALDFVVKATDEINGGRDRIVEFDAGQPDKGQQNIYGNAGLGIAIGGNWYLDRIANVSKNEQAMKSQVSMFPGGPSVKGKEFMFGGGTMDSLIKGAKQQDAAWEYTAWIALPEGQFIAQDVSYDVGGHREGAQDTRIVNNRLLRKEILPMFDKATDMAHFYSPTWQAMRDEVTRVQDALLLKQMTPAQGAKELQTKLQAILDDYWSKKK